MNSIPPQRLAPFCLSLALISSVIPAVAVVPKDAALHAVGRTTILAIATGDATYLSGIIDPEGIYIGHHGIKHSTESFRRDFELHIGLYCELFENGCKTEHNPDYTLEYVFKSGGNPRKSDLKFKINGNNGTLEYWEFGGGGDLIATLSYRFAGGKWYLYNIHYV